jgi:hypothetical protein
MYTMRTPITKDSQCTLSGNLMYTYTKIIYKCCRKKIFTTDRSKILFKWVYKKFQVRRCPEPPGFRGGFYFCHLPPRSL